MKIFLTSLLALMITVASAQDFALGFKTGLNYTNLLLESETDATGKELESTEYSSGFQIGILGSYSLTDEFGFRGELLFTQKGGTYKYAGSGNRTYTLEDQSTVTATGFMNESFRVNNSYMEVPIMAYYKIGEKFEVSGGLALALLVTSKASGDRSFEGTTPNSSTSVFEKRRINYNYFNDGKSSDSATTEVTVDGESIILPIEEIKDPNYDEELYNRFEASAVVGASYFFNKSLFLHLRANYGLTDVTNNDVQLFKQSDKVGELKNSSDKNITISATIGFSF